MTCPSCHHENRSGAKFCGGCGEALKPACANCGTELPPDVRFCDECGTAVPGAGPSARPAPADESTGARKVVTLLFADLAGSTALHERLDPESARRFMERYYGLAREAVESHGGTLAKLLGDGAMAVFGIPRVAEDDAIRAVRAAVAMQEAFRALAEQQRGLVGETGLRVAVNSGEVVVKGETEIIGDPVNVAARLQERGQNGDVVIGEATRRLVQSQVTLEFLGSLDLKGRAEAVKGYRVVSLAAPGRTAAPFVGREDELARIAAVFDGAVGDSATRLAVLLGSPGLGKSRLIAEFARRSGNDATVIQASCDAAGGATFAPLADALRDLLSVETGASSDSIRHSIESALPERDTEAADGERGRVVHGIAGILAGTPGAPEETFFVVRRFLAGLAISRPVVLVVDDLQWGEPLLFDLLEHLVQWGRSLPMLVLVGARPELRDVRSSFATPSGLVADVVGLEGLDGSVAMRLAAAVVGASDLPAAVAARVLASSEGNPLFIGELVRMLVDEGALVRDGERWTTGEALATVEMPPTIHALLAARIERLEPAQCTVLERAAVVGRQFSRSSLASLMAASGPAAGDVAGLDVHLEALQRAQLIERDTGWLLGEPVLRFHHVLIRDAAYRRLLKGTRAELHERLATWIEERVGEATEHDETIGRHFEEAHRLLGELGPIDVAGERLGERAAARLAAAGRRALDGDDVPLAAGLLGRALERRREDDPARADLALDWCEALLTAGDVATAARAIEEIERCIQRAQTGTGSEAPGSVSRLRAWHACFIGHHTVLTAPEALSETAEQVAEAAASLAALEDASGEANGHYVHALALARLGRVGACETSLDQALAAARRAGDRRRANTVLAIAPVAALWGPSPVTRASGRCLDVVRVLRITQGAPAVEAVALSCQGVLEALRGRTDAARRMIASGRGMVEELGIAQRLHETDVFAGFVAMLEGDAPAAAKTLRGAYDGLRDLGLGIDAARAASLLARALLAQDCVEEAEALSHESEALAGDDLKSAIAWRGVRAEALARRGEHAAAMELATAGVEIAAATDALLDHADARLALAATLRAAGRSTEADVEQARAIELWEAKGATLLAGRAQDGSVPSAGPGPTTSDGSDVRCRSVRPNWAVEEARRVEAAIDAGDVHALLDVYRTDVEIVDHMHGLEYGYEEICNRVRTTIEESTGGAFRHEALATLGDAVALCRMRNLASGSELHGTWLGETESVYLLVIEADEHGCARRIDIYGEEALGDALTCLYRRHAALRTRESDGPRAEAMARTVAGLQSGVGDPDVLATLVAPNIEAVDHRVLGTWSVRGAAAFVEQMRGLKMVAEDVEFHWETVVALEGDTVLARIRHQGVERSEKGRYERVYLWLFAVDSDGRLVRSEYFEDGEPSALLRFETLVDGAGDDHPVRRGVRLNAATTTLDGITTGFARGDREAIAGLLSDSLHTVEHLTGSTYGREGQLESIDRMLRATDLDVRSVLLATLGASLCLSSRRVQASGMAGGRFDVAEYEMDHLLLTAVDENGRLQTSEVFAADRLGDALARFYELYSETLPEGPERIRAAGIAQSLSVLQGRIELDRVGGAYAAGVRLSDHRVFATWSSRGREELVEHFRHQLELVQDFAARTDDVLALEPDRMVVRITYYGTGRASGGDFENRICVIYRFDAEGRIDQVECYEAEREADVLAHFDSMGSSTAGGQEALASSRPAVARRLRPNGATRLARRMETAFLARDRTAIAQALSDEVAVVDHPTGGAWGREGQLDSADRVLRLDSFDFQMEPLATLGESLALARRRIVTTGTPGGRYDVADYETDNLVVLEVDGDERQRRSDVFAGDRLGDAVVRLYERYAELQRPGSMRDRVTAAARTVRMSMTPFAAGREAQLDRDVEMVDHRKLGTWNAVGAADALKHFGSLAEVADDATVESQDILALETNGHALLLRRLHTGTERTGGGSYERPFLLLAVLGPEGQLKRVEFFDVGEEARALARFEEVCPGPDGRGAEGGRSRRPFRTNRATATWERFAAAIQARDVPALEGTLTDSLVYVHHPTGATYGKAEAMATELAAFRAKDFTYDVEMFATLGESLVLGRQRVSISGLTGTGFKDFGPAQMDALIVARAGAGEMGSGFERVEEFDVDRLGQAVVRLYELYAEGLSNGPARTRAMGVARSLSAYDGPVDPETIAKVTDPGARNRDHRVFGTWTTSSSMELVQHYRAQLDLAPDFSASTEDVLALGPAALLVRMVFHGTVRESGGAFENPVLQLWTLGTDGRVGDSETFEAEREEEALARFHEVLGKGGTPDSGAALGLENLATTALEEGWMPAYRTGYETDDWEPMREVCAPGLFYGDRRRMNLLEGDVELMLASIRQRAEVGALPQLTRVGAAGDRICIHRGLWSGGPAEGRFEIEYLVLIEADASARISALFLFDLKDARAALREAWARWARIDPEMGGVPSFIEDLPDSFNEKNAVRWRAVFADDVVVEDHRLAGMGRIEGADKYTEAVVTLWELAPSTRAEMGWWWPAMAPHGGISVVRRTGAVPDGGGDFESEYLFLYLAEQGRISRVELFELNALERALARFEELRPPERLSVSTS